MNNPGIAIIGLGRVGAFAPSVPGDTKNVPVIRNHCDAVLAENRCELIALIDEDSDVRDKISSTKVLPAHVQLLSAPSELKPCAADVIVLCTAGGTRRALVPQVLNLKPRLLIVEKPLAMDSKDGKEILAMADRAGVEVRVNFNRRMDPALVRYHALMPDIPVSVICRYNKGLFNYASHMVDLLCHWYGPVRSVRAHSCVETESDPTVSFTCEFSAGFEAVFVGVTGAAYDLFEADLLFSHGAMTLTNNGVEKRIFESVEDLYYPGYSHLAEMKGHRGFSRTGGFVELYGSIADFFLDEKPLGGCSGLEGLKCLDILEAVLKSCRMNGNPVEPVEREII